ncbi:hypothetical protein BJV82DRAFT_575219 [Fennellomyces sp. T-0311]|nr:hypothetical protein BJV82DRAFT_575219 [Fennellomyces sp. T-0311]
MNVQPPSQAESSIPEAQSFSRKPDTAHAHKMRKIQELKAVLRELEQDSPPPRYERIERRTEPERHNDRDRMLLLEQRIEAIQAQVPANDIHRSSMREIVQQIPNGCRGADGSMKPNPFWVEIYEPKRRYKRPRTAEALDGLTKRRRGAD